MIEWVSQIDAMGWFALIAFAATVGLLALVLKAVLFDKDDE